jgi:hypothetical protein
MCVPQVHKAYRGTVLVCGRPIWLPCKQCVRLSTRCPPLLFPIPPSTSLLSYKSAYLSWTLALWSSQGCSSASGAAGAQPAARCTLPAGAAPAAWRVGVAAEARFNRQNTPPPRPAADP